MEKPRISGLALSDLIDAEGLRRELAQLAAGTPDSVALRAAALALVKVAFNEGRTRVKRAVEENGLQGLAAARALSGLQDVVIGAIHDFATCHIYPDSAAERIAVAATGGYGRGELAPGSDIDLLFLRPPRATARGESNIEFILYMLWDLGLKVGHATRTVAEGLRLARTDVTIRTAMLEARHLCGDKSLFEEMRRKFREDAAGNGRDFVEAKLAERKARHTRQGESRYLVEPNLKESKGGLRDLQTLYWIGKYLYGVENAADLVEHNVFTRDEFKTFQKAEAFLWNVRVRLHYLLGRAEERLSFDVQPALAAAMGYQDAEKPRRAVEAFMRAYFLIAKDV
ncbi:MAG: nucleotidyltransferase domain-containing protein, partial [Alphaproteobacteria bacterium]|nr:nucleotidyltransferase domain-containing protein [Alphaproteobacteria bacterium]